MKFNLAYGLALRRFEMDDTLNQSALSQFMAFSARIYGSWNKFVNGYCRFWISQSINGVIVVGSLLLFILAMAFAYSFLFPRYEPKFPSFEIPKCNGSIAQCNVFDGSWIQDDSYPLYKASECPFAERGFNCLANGRRDNGYTKWRWKPKNCKIPRFDARRVLDNLRGKRIVFVGDSLSRTQWESLICMLMTGVEDKRSVHEINGNKITKQIRFLGVIFRTYGLRIDFYRSVFLVQPGGVPRHAPKRIKSTLKLDQLDDISNEWIDSDVLIFNSGHWWTSSKLFDMGCYFQARGSLKLGMPITTGFRTALQTWASWAEANINANRTTVFFRTFEASHWSGKNRLYCKVTRRPSTKARGKDRSTISDMIMKTLKKMSIPVIALHVTPMGAFRSDAHVGRWSDNPSVPDCSHWCLPGVPDMWNEILLSYLMYQNEICVSHRSS